MRTPGPVCKLTELGGGAGAECCLRVVSRRRQIRLADFAAFAARVRVHELRPNGTAGPQFALLRLGFPSRDRRWTDERRDCRYLRQLDSFTAAPTVVVVVVVFNVVLHHGLHL